VRSKNVGLAFQGGGAYAAFTAGVVRELLNPRRRFLPAAAIRSISGTSGGALNAAMLGLGIHENQKDPSTHLNRFWEFNRMERAIKDHCAPLHLMPDDYIAGVLGFGRHLRDALPHMATSMDGTLRSHRALNRIVDEVVREVVPGLAADPLLPLLPSARPYVTVAATEVRTASAHLFTNNARMIARFRALEIARRYPVLHPLCLQGVYASAAHPQAFAPVSIGDCVYWDGYFMANPPFNYLFREGCDEVVLIRLVQPTCEEVAEDAEFIKNRSEEIAQSAALAREIQSFFEIRELWGANQDGLRDLESRLQLRRPTSAGLFHEIRLAKCGAISEQGYPFASFIDDLLDLGQQVVADAKGFISTYRRATRGLQVISEVDFRSRQVTSEVVDIDALFAAAQDPVELRAPRDD
jgi:NTE family protein